MECLEGGGIFNVLFFVHTLLFLMFLVAARCTFCSFVYYFFSCNDAADMIHMSIVNEWQGQVWVNGSR